MVRETSLSPANLIWPLFVTEGEGVEEPIASLPGVSRWSVDGIVERAREAVALGIPCLALFPNTQFDRRSDDGAEALNPDNLMCRAIRAIKQALGESIGVLTDVALDPYTAHGQDGLLDDEGYVLNDATVESAGRPVAQSGSGGRRHHRAIGHDGWPHRRDPRGAGSARPPQCPDHELCRQIRQRLLRPVPRCGRLVAGCSRATRRAIRWTRPTATRRCARSRWTSPRAPTA